MRQHFLFILFLIGLVACDQVNNSLVPSENENELYIANLEYRIASFLKTDGLVIKSDQFFKKSNKDKKLVFWISENQCMDCLLANIKLLAIAYNNGRIDFNDFVIVADFESKNRLAILLNRVGLPFNLTDVILSRETLLDFPLEFQGQPTFFVADFTSGRAHFIYQPDIQSKSFSEFYLAHVIDLISRDEIPSS